MKMTDYPCLYRLCETEHSTQCDFFCGLSTIFGMDVPAIIEHSILFAHTSQGVLFKGKGFCAEDIEQFGKKRLERPFSDCITLSSAFSDYDIKNEACRICKLSSTFKNQWIDEERILLSFILQKGTDTNSEELLWNLQEKDFCSVCYLATGKSLRTYPLITFNQYLFKYLKALPSLENLERDELVNNFVPYLHDIIRKSQKKRKIIDITIPTPISISFNTVYDCVMREFSILYSYSPDMLTVTQLAKSKTLVKDSIKAGYVPPRIKHGTIDDTISSVISPVNTTETKHPRYHNSHSSGALFQMNICDMLNIETQTPSPVSILTFHSNDTSPQEDAVMDTHTPPNTMVEFPPAILQNESMAIYRITAKFNTTNTMTSDASLVILPNDISSDLSDNMPQNTPQTIATNNNNVYNPDSNDCTDDSKKIPATLVKVIECTTDDTKFDLICDTHTTDFDVMLEDSHNKEDTSIDEENILNTLHEPSNFLPSTLIADNLETHKKSKMTIDLQLSDIEQTNETISGLCNSCEYSDYMRL